MKNREMTRGGVAMENNLLDKYTGEKNVCMCMGVTDRVT